MQELRRETGVYPFLRPCEHHDALQPREQTDADCIDLRLRDVHPDDHHFCNRVYCPGKELAGYAPENGSNRWSIQTARSVS